MAVYTSEPVILKALFQKMKLLFIPKMEILLIDNFFGTLKSEMFYLKKFKAIQELKEDIHQYIDYYNNDRIRLNLKGKSPIEYRTLYYQKVI